jgi:hypothetical protein
MDDKYPPWAQALVCPSSLLLKQKLILIQLHGVFLLFAFPFLMYSEYSFSLPTLTGFFSAWTLFAFSVHHALLWGLISQIKFPGFLLLVSIILGIVQMSYSISNSTSFIVAAIITYITITLMPILISSIYYLR